MEEIMARMWKATVVLENKYTQEVTVQADDVWRAKTIIEHQYGHIISGPQQVAAASSDRSSGSNFDRGFDSIASFLLIGGLAVAAVLKWGFGWFAN
jgi:hypothetical protein